MADVIYEDLEIDFSGYLKDPHTFAKLVHEKGEELRAILNTNDSVSSYLSGLPKISDEETKKWVNEAKKRLEEFYYWVADEVPTQALSEVATEIRNLAGSVEYIGRDRAYLELSKTMAVQDKSLIHQQYCELRLKFNEYLKAMVTLNRLKKDEIEPLKAMPGNYGSTVGLVHYVFRFGEEEDTYRNHRAVAKKLGLPHDILLQDLLEYIEENDCGVSVRKVKN